MDKCPHPALHQEVEYLLDADLGRAIRKVTGEKMEPTRLRRCARRASETSERCSLRFCQDAAIVSCRDMQVSSTVSAKEDMNSRRS
jgi:hypothetical protein